MSKATVQEEHVTNLLRDARSPTPAEVRAQRVSFAMGNAAIEDPRVTQEMAERAAASVGSRTRR